MFFPEYGDYRNREVIDTIKSGPVVVDNKEGKPEEEKLPEGLSKDADMHISSNGLKKRKKKNSKR